MVRSRAYGQPVLRAALILTAAASLALPVAARASSVRVADASDASSYQAAVATGYMPTPPGEIVVDPSGCPGGLFKSCSFAWAPRTLYLEPHDPVIEPFHGMFDHELGHAVDGILAETNTAHRAAFLQFLALPVETPWETTLREKFADLYGTCAQRGLTTTAAETTTLSYGFAFTAAEYAAGCALLLDLTSSAGFDAPAAIWSPPPTPTPPAVPYKPHGLPATYRCGRTGAWRTYKKRPRHCQRLIVVPVKGRVTRR